ncbi:MAG: YgiT-type zinc finger protein [Deltaproteobacteria bacterium]
MKKQSTKKCPECSGNILPGETNMVFELSDTVFTIKNVAADVCAACGQSFITGHVASEVNRLVNRMSEDVQSFVKTVPGMAGRRHEVAIAV